MPANDLNAAVVLLANHGLARDKLRQAVINAGGRIVLEAEPAQADAAQVLAAAPAAVVIALDASTDQALDALEPVLDQAGVMVLLEEAELAAQREGWDAQRWERHLAAKLQGHANVLPPGAEEEHTLHPEPGKPENPAQAHAHANLDAHVQQAHAFAPAVPGDALQLQDDLSAGNTWDAATTDLPLDSSLDGEDYSYEPSAAGNDFSAFETFLQQADAAPAQAPAPSLEALFASTPAAIVDAPAEPAVAAAPAVVMPPPLPPLDVAVPAVAPVAPAADAAPLSQWSLVDFDSSADVVAAPVVDASPAPAAQWDLSRLSLMDLDADEGQSAGQQTVEPVAKGVALVMAGIGGPDAIRRLLALLPAEGMPGAVLIQLRLDGGRYANLVSQLQRVSAAPVQLAEAGNAVLAGHVYVISDDVTITGSDALRFDTLAPMASVLADLPAADGAVLMLSGADADQVEAVLRLAGRGAWVAGQSGEGCYDPAAASALAVAGMPIGEPAWLARELLARWGL